MRRQRGDPTPLVRVDEALSEKAFNAERAISAVRLLVVGANSFIYVALTDKTGSVPQLAYSVIAVAGIYSIYEYFFEPYRRYAVFLSAYFSAVTDAALIIFWLYATGGFDSAFFVLLYPAMVSVAFRFSARETAFAALVYSGGYFALLFALGQVSGHGQQILVRITYIFLTAVLGHLISREVLEQTQRKITLKQHMKLVEAAEAKFRALAETANDAIISAAASGRIIYANPLAQRIFGYSAEEMASTSLTDLIGSAGVVGKTIELTATKKDGTQFPAELSLAAWRSADGHYQTAVIREIAERKRAEQTALALIREQMRRTIAEEAERRSTLLAEASRVLGASLDHEAGLRQLAGLVVPIFADACAIDLIGGDGSLERVAHFPEDDKPGPEGIGSFLTLAMISQRVHGVITFGMAQSGREFDQSKVSTADELCRRAAIAVEHSRLFGEAQEAIRARDDFLSVASHELNTPLTALQLQIDLLQQQTATGGKLLSRLKLVRRQVMRLTKLIRNLLDVSRISSGKLALEFEEVDLCEVVRDAVERTDEMRRGAGSPLEVSTPGPVIGRWDRLRIEQVVLNLLTNAIKYGEGRPIEVSVENTGEIARLKVRDFGMGIPGEDQGRIFERFSRVHPSRGYSGFGLGLWIVQQVVSALGGSIEVHSRPKEGSTFTVELPICEPQSLARSASAEIY